MAILGPADLPVILKVPSDPIKKYVISMLGHPITEVELSEDQLETILRITGDHIAHYFPKEQRLAFFYTIPLQSEYDFPNDAYWIQEVAWDPVSTRIGDIFGAESFLFNIGNVTGIQNILTDYHSLLQYRRFSQRILSTEGHWEVIGDRKIRLYPTPKGAFPILVLYIPPIKEFKTPQTRRLASDLLLAEAKIALGNVRSKYGSIPSPDGGSITLNGEALRQEGEEAKKNILDFANSLGEPMPIVRW